MQGFDCLIGKSLVDIVRNDLSQKTLEKIEQRLFEKFGTSLNQATEDFLKLDNVLREFFGDGAEGIEKQFLRHLIALEQNKGEDKEWIAIENPNLTKLILQAIGDDDKNKILNSVLDQSKIISDILIACNIPQTSGYRKVNALIQDGFLIVNGHETTHDGKKVSKYKSIFENIKINIEKNKAMVQVQLTKESEDSSKIMQLLRGQLRLVTME